MIYIIQLLCFVNPQKIDAHFLVYDKQVELFSVLNNTISYLDDLISCNQLKNISLIESIEYQLIKCISIIGFSIENDSAKLQNVMLLIIYYLTTL